MTDAERTEILQLIRDHSSPLVHALIDQIERTWAVDRGRLLAADATVTMLNSVTGHRVYTDNDSHSRRADLRSA